MEYAAYLRILHLAAFRSEVEVEAALQSLLENNGPIDQEAVAARMAAPAGNPAEVVAVEAANLAR